MFLMCSTVSLRKMKTMTNNSINLITGFHLKQRKMINNVQFQNETQNVNKQK